jgi:CRP-like cAMP-binding protein
MFELEGIVSKFPVFSSLNKENVKELAQMSLLKEVKKNQIIYKENAPSDNLYIVVSGRVKTYTESSLREERVLEYLYKGTCFGIISLLTNQPHSVTAEAANDSLIIQIPKDEFTKFLNNNPFLAVEFSKILSRRVKKRADKDKNIFVSLIIAVSSVQEKIGKTRYSIVLAKALKEESGKKVLVLEVKNNREGFFFTSPEKVLELGKFTESAFNSFFQVIWGFDNATY